MPQLPGDRNGAVVAAQNVIAALSMMSLLVALVVVHPATARAADLPPCPSTPVTTTLKITDTDTEKSAPLIATHPLMLQATATTPGDNPWQIAMDSVTVTPAVADGVFFNYTPPQPGPLVFTIGWVQTQSVPDPTTQSGYRDDTCRGSESRTVQVRPATATRVAKPFRVMRNYWFLGHSELFELPVHEHDATADDTPVVATLRVRRGTRIPHDGPSATTTLVRNADTGDSHPATMNGVRVKYSYGSFQVLTSKYPGPRNSVQIDITQGTHHLRSVSMDLRCSLKIALVYACIYHLR